MKNNNDNNKKKKVILIVAIAVVLAVIVGSGVAIGVFRIAKGSASGNGDKKAFTDKITTEATTQVAKATTEKATKATTKKAAKAEKVTTEKAKKVASVSGGITTEAKNDSTKATTEAQTAAQQPVTEAQTEAPYVPDTETPYVPDTEAPAPTTERATERATEAPTEAPTTQHQHSWEAITETTTEKVKVKDAWDEQVLKYYCSYCGADCDVVGSDHITYCGEKYYSEKAHQWRYEGASWKGGYETINHPAEYTTKEVTKTVGYKCTTCGATK